VSFPNLSYGPRSALAYAGICTAQAHCPLYPNSDRKSRHAAMVMSALHLKSGHVQCRSSCLLLTSRHWQLSFGSPSSPRNTWRCENFSSNAFPLRGRCKPDRKRGQLLDGPSNNIKSLFSSASSTWRRYVKRRIALWKDSAAKDHKAMYEPSRL
jgi:hypothetical protein